jgi:hypothetical protein
MLFDPNDPNSKILVKTVYKLNKFDRMAEINIKGEGPCRGLSKKL